VPGAALITGALMLGVYTIVEAAHYGWGSAHTLGLGALAIALSVAFATRESRAAVPLVPLRIFRQRTVTAANAIQLLMVAGIFGMFFLGALYLQRVLGYSPLEVGLAFLPVALSIGALSLGASARLIVRFGARATLLPGLVLVAAGLALFQRTPLHAVYITELLPAMLLLGIGAGLSFPALMTLAMSRATAEDSGLASGLVNTTQQMGGALGLAVLATLSTTRTEHLLGAGGSTAAALTGGYRLAFTIAAGLVLAGLALAAVVLRPEVEAVPAVAEAPAAAEEAFVLDEAA
jgi:MFS family permease